MAPSQETTNVGLVRCLAALGRLPEAREAAEFGLRAMPESDRLDSLLQSLERTRE